MKIDKLKKNMDTTVLENLITGRVYPHIYAFSTNTVPKYWKIGDTVRPVETRLSEWRKHYYDLTQEYSRAAKVGDKFFRDYAIHSYLERELGKERLQRENTPAGLYYSNEFFKDVNTENLEDAFNHIEQDAVQGGGIYQLYNEQHLPVVPHYERETEPYKLRPNQDDAVKAFMAAKEKGRTKLLMYAVMRFGKSFTSMCCAKKMSANIVVIVSGKADVKEEWKKTIEKIANFDGFVFLDGEQLLRDKNVISSNLESGHQVAIFLTLQDIKGDKIKRKHKEVFDSQIDLLIVDETHYGARAAEYGKVLQDAGLTKTEINNELKQNDIESVEEIDIEVQKHLNAKITLHLSGTPYRILMSSEFSEDDIISFCQFTDIIDASEDWIEKNNKKEKPQDEWENPYYGFPQMIRFAFTPNESSIKRIQQLKEQGISASLSVLLRPQSIEKDTEGNYKKFKNETEVFDLLKAIDGSQEDENIFPFLNYEKIKKGEMCHHIVFVLPYRASCDAMQELIANHSGVFNNLSEYEIINIAGVDSNTLYPSVKDIKSKIKRCESEGKKTITLTVNRMLTGNTVEEWDTMIFLKDTASPQEYDQAIFRLQNQYIVTYEDAEGRVIKYNKKPQTLLVDFDVDRMFRLQELKSQFYNANTEANGNDKLETRLRRELEVSPIICLNKNKLHQVTSANIMDAVREYSQSRSVIDEATDIPVDENILTDDVILSIINNLVPIDSKKGITFKSKEEGDDIDTEEGNSSSDSGDHPDDKDSSQNRDGTKDQPHPSKDETKELAKKLQTYYLQILFFAFLTESKVDNLRNVIEVLSANDDNRRIARNLALDRDKLVALHSKCSHFIHSKLDYKISNINNLIKDEKMDPIRRAEVALTQFGRMSDSEIVTPNNIAADMIAMLPEMKNLTEVKFLDIASKQGEFAYAIYNRFTKKEDAVKNNIYSLPTSSLCYEFTRKIYKLLGMPVENVIADFTTYDLIKENNKEKIKKLKDMKFDVIVGNPPYQSHTIDTSDTPIYHLFMDVAFQMCDKVSFITPARFLFNAGKTPRKWNNRILNDPHFKVVWYNPKSTDVFPNVDLKGGVAITFRNTVENWGSIGTFTAFYELNTIIKKVSANTVDTLNNIIYPQNKFILGELYKDFPSYRNRIGSNGKEKRLTTSIFELTEIFKENRSNSNELCILGLVKNIRTYKYVSPKYIESHKNLKKYKVLVPKSNGSGAIGEVLSTPLIGEPLIGYTQSFISIGSFDNLNEAEACLKYIKSKFARVMLGTLKATQDNSKEVWKLVPLQDFTNESDIDWSKSVAEIDKQLYAKYNLEQHEIDFIESKIKPME